MHARLFTTPRSTAAPIVIATIVDFLEIPRYARPAPSLSRGKRRFIAVCRLTPRYAKEREGYVKHLLKIPFARVKEKNKSNTKKKKKEKKCV